MYLLLPISKHRPIHFKIKQYRNTSKFSVLHFKRLTIFCMYGANSSIYQTETRPSINGSGRRCSLFGYQKHKIAGTSECLPCWQEVQTERFLVRIFCQWELKEPIGKWNMGYWFRWLGWCDNCLKTEEKYFGMFTQTGVICQVIKKSQGGR